MRRIEYQEDAIRAGEAFRYQIPFSKLFIIHVQKLAVVQVKQCTIQSYKTVHIVVINEF